MFQPDDPRRRLPPLLPQLQPAPVQMADFGAQQPQLQSPQAASPTGPPPGINVPQMMDIANGVMGKFFKSKPVGGAGSGMASALSGQAGGLGKLMGGR